MKKEDYMGNPVISLQTMLRQLSQVYDFMPEVPLDGTFGESTLESVLIFQKELYPPATGIVNQEVWEAIRGEVMKNSSMIQKPKVLRAYPEAGDPLVFGEEGAEIALFQLMFQSLSDEIYGIEEETPTGIFTETLRNNLTWLQSVSGISPSGELNPETWDRLARLYEVFITKI